jgi:malonyl-CoA decarboxylase
MATDSSDPRSAARTLLAQVASIADRGRRILDRGAMRGDLAATCGRLVSGQGEATSLALAMKIVTALGELDSEGTVDFLEALRERFSPDPRALESAISLWREKPDATALTRLAGAVEAPRQELFRRLNMVPGGTEAIVRLRGRLLEALPLRPDLSVVDADLRHLLASWFNRGFLRLERITWESPASLLERLIRYEAVHEIESWEDLHLRLAADRRCFAYFHPALPGEPLIFVEVALCDGLAVEMRPLLDRGRKVGDAGRMNTAIFYSISNCQPGLRGISFGSFLIKQVAAEIASELPGVTTFATLSPLPGLASAFHDTQSGSFTDARLKAILGPLAADVIRGAGEVELRPALEKLARSPARTELAANSLRRVALAYLLEVRQGGRVADPVLHFHSSNGARLERINPSADLSAHGLEGSFGVMANYLYDLDRLEENHERYVESGRVAVAAKIAREAKHISDAWWSADRDNPRNRPVARKQ